MKKFFLALTALTLLAASSFAADKYWVGGTENWNSTAGSKWSLSSGGAGGAAIPDETEIAFLDANSGVVTVTMATTDSTYCHSLDFSGFTGTYASNAKAINIGDGVSSSYITLGSGMTWTYGADNQPVNLKSTVSGNTIRSNGITITAAVTSEAADASWSLLDAITLSATKQLTVPGYSGGTFSSGGFTITAGKIGFNSSNTVTLGASSVVLTGIDGIWTMDSSNTFTANTAAFSITSVSADVKTFAGGGKTYNTLAISGTGTGSVNFTGANTWSNFPQITGGTKTIKFTAGTTTTFTGGTTFGNGTNVITISSITAATHTLSKASGTVSADYLHLTNSVATGGATWYAGANSTDNGGNTGWIFTAPPPPSSGGARTLMDCC